MKRILILLALSITLFAFKTAERTFETCAPSPDLNIKMVTNPSELEEAIAEAKPGDQIVMANGTWKDVQIRFTGKGTEDQPITLKAESPGKVFIEGESDLKFGGAYLIAHGLYFRNGYTPSKTVVGFMISKTQVARHCTLNHSVIEDYNQPFRDRQDFWVEFWGQHNTMSNCYIAGKSNQGPTVRVEIKGNRNIRNFHRIVNNHFGPRPRKGGPKGETIQLGDSFSSMSPSNTTVAYNLFEACNGEVEIISSKTNFNVFKGNVFYKSEGSLVTRHGNYCVIDGNYFIGDGQSENYGGIRLINTGHSVVNNYFININGKNFRSALAVMNGIPKSPLNRYNQVTDVTVAYNTWVDCASPLQFGVGTNISQAEVLPKSEIRSAKPIRTEVANNIIYSSKGDTLPIVAHDKDELKGITFSNNYIHNNGVAFSDKKGMIPTQMTANKVNEYLLFPTVNTDNKVYAGYGFEAISKDIFGNARTATQNTVGAINTTAPIDPNLLDKTKYGAKWFTNERPKIKPTTHTVSDTAELTQKMALAKSGDIIALAPGTYALDLSIPIAKAITIQSQQATSKAELDYTGAAGTPLFEMNPKGRLSLKNLILKGTGTQMAFASLKANMSSLYTLAIEGTEISNFGYVLKAYKASFADYIHITNSSFTDCENGIELSEETNDKGDYNTEFLTITDCSFNNIAQNVIDYYRGGYDESTIGGNLLVTGSTFTNCGAKESNGILLNTRGIINVNIAKNTFKNNPVKLVALLWGAKNNTHSDNKIGNSGKLIVEENLKLKLVY